MATETLKTNSANCTAYHQAAGAYPPTGDTHDSEFSAGEKSTVSTDDVNAVQTNGTIGNFANQCFHFKSAQARANITQIDVTHKGLGVAETGNGVALYAWDYVGSAWVLVANHNNATKTTLTWLATAITVYLDVNSNMKFRVTNKGTDYDFPVPYIQSHYFEVVVTYTVAGGAQLKYRVVD